MMKVNYNGVKGIITLKALQAEQARRHRESMERKLKVKEMMERRLRGEVEVKRMRMKGRRIHVHLHEPPSLDKLEVI